MKDTERVSKSSKRGMNFKGQKYSSLRKDALKHGEPFTDKEFPANNKSLFYSRIDNEIEWKRPHELCKVPRLVVEGVTCDDLNEGELGNTWFVTACASLALEAKLWNKVIPDVKQQEYSAENDYAGIFHFQFWRYGEWIDVVIDDLLPTKGGKLVFCHSKSRNEFWSALLEKAFAKLYGDYESLCQGQTVDALVDFTGGVAEKIVLPEINLQVPETRERLFKDLRVSCENKSLMSVSIACKSRSELGQEAGNGLIKGHGYSMTAVKEVNVDKSLRQALGGSTVCLIRLSNPWGTREWTGAWSDESPQWNALSVRDRDKMGIKFQSEGEFWMSFDDFIHHFTNVDICHFVNTSIFTIKKTWNESLMHGEWIAGARGSPKDRAGGNSSHTSFLANPQFCFDIINENGDTVLVSMEQNDTNATRQLGQNLYEIGFHIMKVEENRTFRVHVCGEKMFETEFTPSRNIFAKVGLPKGRFVAIPSTKQPGVTGSFLLRMYTSSNANARPLSKECPSKGLCSSPYALVTVVRVVKIEGLEKTDKQKQKKESVDPYVIVKCEGETVKSSYVNDTLNPEWKNFRAIFYRKKPMDQPITIEVVNHNRILMDEFLGLATITNANAEDTKEKVCDLFGKKKKNCDVQLPGQLHVELTSSYDLTDL